MITNVCTNVFWGIGLHAVGGVAAASCYVPLKGTPGWSYAVLVALLLLPDVFLLHQHGEHPECFVPRAPQAVRNFRHGHRRLPGGQQLDDLETLLEGRRLVYTLGLLRHVARTIYSRRKPTAEPMRPGFRDIQMPICLVSD
jgi:hypothetical protein